MDFAPIWWTLWFLPEPARIWLMRNVPCELGGYCNY
ncbi:hypothetical protein SAMN05444580_104127 [Rhodococcus tukisamuensis]|uniref:Uncharacterized protein n=1 Tax=Rhodococcus tukisamuensis TaxID=168276 RepID=A0A1G6UAN8_9NOCA|nr:hypothetical protein SAMN05444580_104127 [Rhodococcus tukisamuensis]